MPIRIRNLIIFFFFSVFWFNATITPALAETKPQDEAARTEFVYRVNLGRADDVRLLLSRGASANQLSGEGVPVICLAAGRNDPEGVNIIKALLEKGASVKARDTKGQTALHYAAKAGNSASIEYLMEKNIDVYALDNSGSVARTSAYNAGQTEAIKTIDNVIMRQTAEVTKLYRENNRIAENTRRASENAKKMPEAIDNTKKVSEPEPAPISHTPPTSSKNEDVVPAESLDEEAEDTAVNEPDATEKPQKSEAEITEKTKEELNGVIYNMAFNTCAFQYWSYCQSVKQSTDIDKEEVIIAIASSKNEAEILAKKLQNEYEIKPQALSEISQSAQKRIFKELDEMSSNRDRHEKGVGKRDDMRERCEFIARQWGVKPPHTKGGSSGKSKGKSKKGESSGGGSKKSGGKRSGGGARKAGGGVVTNSSRSSNDNEGDSGFGSDTSFSDDNGGVTIIFDK